MLNKITPIDPTKLTQSAHGAGCGCKISPQVLDQILQGNTVVDHPNLLVGNSGKDDAAVYRLNDEEALISTTDFFTPVVDDAKLFGKVAAANAISDVYAMGGKPTMALAILGWPVEKISPAYAQKIVEGAREICHEAGIVLAGGHSIDAPEPFFGLSVNGMVKIKHLKKNDGAQEGDLVLLTKPIGVGILSTAAKRGILKKEHEPLLHDQLIQLNKIGEELGKLSGVQALTDVTGFGLLGHGMEMAMASNVSVHLQFNSIQFMSGIREYLAQQIIPDATFRNWNAYKEQVYIADEVNKTEAFQLLPDPQTNGGLLIAVTPENLSEVQQLLRNNGYGAYCNPIGKFVPKEKHPVSIFT